MSYAAHFARAGVAAERRLDRVVDQMEAQHRGSRDLDALEEEWAAAVADGTVTAAELSRLEAHFQKAGLGGIYEDLAEASGGRPLTDGELEGLSERIGATLRRRQREVRDGEFQLRLQVQYTTADVRQAWESASNASKTEHDAYLNAIRNMMA